MTIVRGVRLIIALLCIISLSVFGQDKEEGKKEYGWTKEIVGNINFSQASFDNWAKGGENSMAWQLILNLKFINDQDRYNLTNAARLYYGMTKLGGAESRKSFDEIKLESNFSYKIWTPVNPYIAFSGETQFTTGYQYSGDTRAAVSQFMDPGYFIESIGLQFMTDDVFKTRLGFALKETVTRDYPMPYADDPETPGIEKIKTEAGLESVSDFSKKLSDTILLTSKLEMFSNLQVFDEIDVRWDNIFTAKISKYVNVSLNFKIFYDRDISKKRQFNQTLAVGLTYMFI